MLSWSDIPTPGTGQDVINVPLGSDLITTWFEKKLSVLLEPTVKISPVVGSTAASEAPSIKRGDTDLRIVRACELTKAQAVFVIVAVGVKVTVSVGVKVEVSLKVSVGVAVDVAVGVSVSVNVLVNVSVNVLVWVFVKVSVGVMVSVTVKVFVGV